MCDSDGVDVCIPEKEPDPNVNGVEASLSQKRGSRRVKENVIHSSVTEMEDSTQAGYTVEDVNDGAEIKIVHESSSGELYTNHASEDSSHDDSEQAGVDEVMEEQQGDSTEVVGNDDDDDDYWSDSDDDLRTRTWEWDRVTKFWDSDSDLHNIKLELGDIFENGVVFRRVLRNYCAEEGFTFGYTRNEKYKIGVICMNEGCLFYLWCSRLQRSNRLSIKRLNPTHNCVKTSENRNVTVDTLTHRYLDYIKDNKHIDVETFQNTILTDIQVFVSKRKIYRAISKGREICRGNDGAQYGKLFKYAQLVMNANPGTKFIIESEPVEEDPAELPKQRFLRLYLRYAAQKQGVIIGCRPFIGLYSCHLEGYYGGQVLAALAPDGNEDMFPIALAIIEEENRESWQWFLEHFFEDLGSPEEQGWVFISDMQEGLVELFEEWLPEVEHRHCVRHMSNIFHTQFKGKKLKEQLWVCAKATSAADFEDEMIKLENMDNDAYTWLKNIPPERWCLAFYSTRAKSSSQVLSLSESFNSWIGKARDLPVICFCEHIRLELMQQFYENDPSKRTYEKRKGDEVNKHKHLLCTQIKAVVDLNRVEAGQCKTVDIGNGIYEVSCMDETNFTVNVSEGTCSCLEWQLSGIPCKHGVAAIIDAGGNPEERVDIYYHSDTFRAVYAGQMFPVSGVGGIYTRAGEEELLPPIICKPPGRGRRRRREGMAEKEQGKASRRNCVRTCGNCHQQGHNARTCAHNA